MKRKLSILLAATMVTSMLPTGVFAASINSVTNTPSTTMNSEWSLKEGNVNTAPQIVARATTKINAGEQVTVTLSGAEWAFYDVGSNFSMNTGENVASNENYNPVTNWGDVRISDGTDTSNGNNISKKAPWVPDTANDIQANGARANSMATYNLAAAALLYPQSGEKQSDTIKKDDIFGGSTNIDNSDESLSKDITDKEFAQYGDNIKIGSSEIYNTWQSAVNKYNDLLNDQDLKNAKENYENAKKEYERRKSQYENASTQTLKDGYKVLMDEAYKDMTAAQVKYEEANNGVDLEKAKDDLISARTALINRISEIKAELNKAKNNLENARKDFESARNDFISELKAATGRKIEIQEVKVGSETVKKILDLDENKEVNGEYISEYLTGQNGKMDTIKQSTMDTLLDKAKTFKTVLDEWNKLVGPVNNNSSNLEFAEMIKTDSSDADKARKETLKTIEIKETDLGNLLNGKSVSVSDRVYANDVLAKLELPNNRLVSESDFRKADGTVDETKLNKALTYIGKLDTEGLSNERKLLAVVLKTNAIICADVMSAITEVTFSTNTVKTVSAVNFYDVVFEAANVISFRLNTDLEVGNKIAIPLLAKVYDDAPTVTLTSATGQFSSSTYQFAKVSSGSTVPSISSAVSFYDTADLYPIVITETTPQSFKTNGKFTNYIKMTLPAGFNWVKTGTASVSSGDYNGTYDVTGWVSSNNSSICSNTNTDSNRYTDGAAIIDPKDNGIATIVLEKSSYDLPSNMLSKIILNGAKIQSKKATAKEGDVKITMKGQNFDSTSLVIAKYGTYGINLSVDKVPDRIAGRSYLNDEDAVKSGKVTFEENVENSWWAERRTEFVVNMGDIRAVDIKVLDDVTEAGDGTSTAGIPHSALVNGITVTNAVEDLSGEKIDSDDRSALDDDNQNDYARGYFQGGDSGYEDYMYITSVEGSDRDFRRFVLNEFVVKDTVGNFVTGERKTKAKMELTFYVEVPATLDSADKDLTVSLEGAAIDSDDKQSVKIANIKEPLTFEIEKKDVNLGYKDVELGTITVTENFKEGFSPVYKSGRLSNDDLKFRVIPSDQYKDIALSQMDSDYNQPGDTPGSINDGQITGDILVKDGKIQRQSTEISKIVLKPRIDLVRYLPEGKYDFKIDGIDELGSDVTIEDYINVITAADNKNTQYASDVKIVADGSTTTMTVGGTSKQMTAAAFIKDDRTMLPLRDVANALGISDDGISFYDGMATIFANGTFVQATNGSRELKVNGASIPMDTEAYIDPATDRMYLPLGFIANAFGVTAQWDGTTKTATLNPSVPTGTPSTKANVSSK